MNIILLTKKDFRVSDTVRLTGNRFVHITKILRSKVGDGLRVGLLNGKIGQAEITSVTKVYVEFKVKLTKAPPKSLPLTLILALPRPLVLNRILASVASMGVKRIYLIGSNRVEKSYWKSPVLQPENITEQLMLGLQQAQDTILPEVFLKNKFNLFVKDQLQSISKRTLRLVAHPYASESCPALVSKAVSLIIGPEGGFIDYEIELLKDKGFKPVILQERILRVEPVIPAFIGRLFK